MLILALVVLFLVVGFVAALIDNRSNTPSLQDALKIRDRDNSED